MFFLQKQCGWNPFSNGKRLTNLAAEIEQAGMNGTLTGVQGLWIGDG